MKLTRERKIFGGILIAGVIALIIDRAGGSASEPVPEESALSAPQRAAGPAVAASVPASKPTLASRIDAIAKADAKSGDGAESSFRDPFRISQSWIGGDIAGGATASPKVIEQPHRLTAVLVAGRRSQAVIDGRLIVIGQEISGLKLVAVTQDMAILERDETRLVLRLEPPVKEGSADIR